MNVPTTSKVSSYIAKRSELHKTRPYKKRGEKDTWETVGKAKLELLEIQKEIALEELRQKKRESERKEEEYQLRLKHMEEIHSLKVNHMNIKIQRERELRDVEL